MQESTASYQQNLQVVGHAPPGLPASDVGPLLEDMVALLARHCVLDDTERDAIALWTAASYVIDEFRIFPKLSLISPEKRCGKTTTMEVIGSFAKDSLMVANISPAAIYRICQSRPRTLFIDEADTFVKGGDADLVGLLNSGHTRATARVLRCHGDNYDATEFSTWMPMVLASIGDLPPTIMDRSVVINLRRKRSNEIVQTPSADFRDHQAQLRERIQSWCAANIASIGAASVKPPDVGNDRAADNWQALFALASVAGGAWPRRCEVAYRQLTTTSEPELSTRLLIDIRSMFQASDAERIRSSDLVEKLKCDEDGPWLTANYGRAVTPHQVASLLRAYGIKPIAMRLGDKTFRGYAAAQFEDAFGRYLS